MKNKFQTQKVTLLEKHIIGTVISVQALLCLTLQ